MSRIQCRDGYLAASAVHVGQKCMFCQSTRDIPRSRNYKRRLVSFTPSTVHPPC